MPKVHPNQSNFSQGELSPLLSERTDLDLYAGGAKAVRNMHSDPRGPVISRVGTRFDEQEIATDAECRTFSVETTKGNFLKIYITDNVIHAWDSMEGAQVSVGAVPIPWTNAQLKDISMFYWRQSSWELYIFFMHPNVEPHYLLIDLIGPGYFFNALSSIVASMPTVWAGTNWPSAGTRFQGRTWMGGDPQNGGYFIGTKSGTAANFTIGAGAPDDAVDYNLDEPGNIVWIDSTKRVLVIGTSSAEFIITSEGGFLKTGDIESRQQSSYGSHGDAVKIGDQLLYVSPDKRKIRQIGFSFADDSWISNDLTFQAEHLTKALIKELYWAQHPSNYLWALLEDGTLICLSYERDKQILGWHRHDTDGNIRSITTLFDGVTSVLVLAVTRRLSSPSLMMIEHLDNRYQMDSWEEVTLGAPGLLATGFNHIDGKTVHVVGDDVLQTDKVVGAESSPGAADGVAGGVYLDVLSTVVVVGTTFLPELETLPMDGGGPTGSARNLKKRRNKIVVNILDSAIPLINGVRQPVRSPSTDMELGEPVQTGDVDTTELGWTRESTVNIQQDLALPLIVRSVRGEVAENSL